MGSVRFKCDYFSYAVNNDNFVIGRQIRMFYVAFYLRQLLPFPVS